MPYFKDYTSQLGTFYLRASDTALTGLAFTSYADADESPGGNDILSLTEKWLNIYLSGEEPDFMPPLELTGTPFQKEIWQRLLAIPYGRSVTYGEIAREMAEKRGLARMSAQAVGQAVGANPIAILVPCHRVLGKNGALTGYAGGIKLKETLLNLEGNHELSPTNTWRFTILSVNC